MNASATVFLVFGFRLCSSDRSSAVTRPATMLLAVILTTLFAALPSAAQEPDTTVFVLPEVEVQAVRDTETEASAPFTISVLRRSSEALTYEAPATLESMLREVPGVWMNDRGHLALGERLVVRGMGWRSPFGVRGIQVLLDGIPLTMPDGQAVLDIADPLFVRRAEIIRGPSSLFWGNASGGVLFLSTEPAAEDPSVRLRLGTGSHGLRQLSGEGQVDIGAETWSLAVSDLRRDGFREHSEGRFTRALLHGGVGLGAQTHLQVMGAFADQDTRHPGSLTREEFNENPQQANPGFQNNNAGKLSTQVQLGARLLHETAGVDYSAIVYGGVRELANPLPWAYVAFDRLFGGMRATAQGNLARLQWHAGLDAGLQRDDRLNRDHEDGEPTGPLSLDQLETVRSGATYGYLRLPLTDRLDITAGARLDVVDFSLDDRVPVDGVDESGSRTFSAVSPGFGISYRAGPVHTFANYNAAFETPTTTELVNQADRAGAFNPDLSPQRTHGFELGARGAWPQARLQFDVAGYFLRVNDRLVQFERDDGRAYFQNIGANRHLGAEATITWMPRRWMEWQLAYTGNQLTFLEEALEGNRIPGVPDHRLASSLRLSYADVWLRLSLETVSDYFADNANTVRNEGYTLIDVRFGQQTLRLGDALVHPYIEIGNVLDRQYSGSVSINASGERYFEPAPGRTFKAGITVTL